MIAQHFSLSTPKPEKQVSKSFETPAIPRVSICSLLDCAVLGGNVTLLSHGRSRSLLVVVLEISLLCVVVAQVQPSPNSGRPAPHENAPLADFPRMPGDGSRSEERR